MSQCSARPLASPVSSLYALVHMDTVAETEAPGCFVAPESVPSLSRRQILRLAVAADVDPRTVVKSLESWRRGELGNRCQVRVLERLTAMLSRGEISP